MKLEITSVRITADDGRKFDISRYDDDGEELPAGEYELRDSDDNWIVVTVPLLKAFLRAADAADSGMLLDEPNAHPSRNGR